jgi:broad specificity phosphatase PhoE
MPTRAWLLRHAETAEPDIFHGAESDIGLSERGLRHAELLAPFFADKSAAAVVSSAMRRALDTAHPIARACRLAIQIEHELHERRVGILTGMPTKPEGPLWLETVRRWTAGELDFATEGAESFAAMQSRILPIWTRLETQFRDRTFIVIAHGAVIKVLLLSILPGWSPREWKQFGSIPNLGVSELIRTEQGWHAASLNQVPEACREGV